MVNKRLGGYHSAKVLLKSIDYHDIMSNYGKDPQKIADLLFDEILELTTLKPGCIIICCNSLHKHYDLIKAHLYTDIPVFHAIELVAQHAQQQQYKKMLLLATKTTMEDGFFAKTLEKSGIEVVIPNLPERDAMQKILSTELIHNVINPVSRDYFSQVIAAHPDCQAVVLGCTEFPMLIDSSNSLLPIINPVQLQCHAAVDFALQ